MCVLVPEWPFPVPIRHLRYQGQAGWKDLLQRFQTGGGQLLDLEFLTDESGTRGGHLVASHADDASPPFSFFPPPLVHAQAHAADFWQAAALPRSDTWPGLRAALWAWMPGANSSSRKPAIPSQ